MHADFTRAHTHATTPGGPMTRAPQ
jgi:hypothetical protein